MSIENIFDYLLADTDLTLDQVIDIIDFYSKDFSKQKMIDIKNDLFHAFLN